MTRISSISGILAAAVLLPSVAAAQSAWVGRWFYVPEASRRSPSSFTLTALPRGRLRFDAGWGAFTVGDGGKPAPDLSHPTTLIRTEMLTSSAFRYVEIVGGRPVARTEQRLSPDGARLLGRVTTIGKDGRESGQSTVSMRVGAGHGLTGRWRELPPEHDAVREGSRIGSQHPYWIIAQAPSGVMTWRVVPTGEVLTGAPDGRRHPAAGPRKEGRSFSIRMLGARHLRFLIYENERLIAQTDDTLSADGKRWTNLLWSPAYPGEKDRLVYQRD